MASRYVIELRELDKTLREDGWELRANIARDAAERMERLEQLIVDSKDRFDDIASVSEGQ